MAAEGDTIDGFFSAPGDVTLCSLGEVGSLVSNGFVGDVFISTWTCSVDVGFSLTRTGSAVLESETEPPPHESLVSESVAELIGIPCNRNQIRA